MINIDLVMESMGNIISAKDKIQNELDGLYKQEEYHNDMTNDFQHELEMLNLSDLDITNIGYKMQYNFRQRREVKDRIDKLKGLNQFFSEPEVKSVLSYMGNNIGVLRKRIKKDDSRAYKMRINEETPLIFKEYETYEYKQIKPKVIPDKKRIRRKTPKWREEER